MNVKVDIFALEESLFGYEKGDEWPLDAGLRTYRQPPGSSEGANPGAGFSG